MCEEDPRSEDFKTIQIAQNDMMRFITGCKTKDKVSTKSLLEKCGFLSINQLNAQVKLMEIWKAKNVDNYLLKIKQQESTSETVTTRAAARGRPCEIGRSKQTQNSCISDAIRIWNIAPDIVKNCKSLYSAKVETKKYVKTLPI